MKKDINKLCTGGYNKVSSDEESIMIGKNNRLESGDSIKIESKWMRTSNFGGKCYIKMNGKYVAGEVDSQYADLICTTMNEKEQYTALVESHAELLDIVKGLSVIFYKELQSKLMPDEKTKMYPLIKDATAKGIKLNNILNK